MSPSEISAISLTGLLLCGGNSTRMGVDKLVQPWEGERLVDGAAGVLRSHCEELLALGREYDLQGFHCVPDRMEDQGPFQAVLDGLVRMMGTHALVLSGDFKHPSVELATEIQSISERHPEEVVLFQRGDQLEPLFGVYPKTQLPALQ
ncbi:MAG: NTP transferase domain-containing protein, partial [Planctomycetes bacterium]|nr:NTP transferase domain-containing protein [Planctomycetota bacterium]